MGLVTAAAFGVGGATVLGAFMGFFFRKIPTRLCDWVLSFAAGVMLCAAVFGLIEPALGNGSMISALVVAAGIFLGGVFISEMSRLVPHLYTLAGIKKQAGTSTQQLDRVLLFVIAIAVHNLPEGMAAGVSFGTGNTADALTVASGIALQNIPEGMVIIAPMLSAGISPGRTLLIALSTGLIEILGTLLGYCTIHLSILLPFALAFAAGTMLYVICDEMIPETHQNILGPSAAYALLAGFGVMLTISAAIA